ncbi:proton-conducting transporter membrane subunit [Kosmotoga pacifica]|uniref:NADH dehydrogenase n=1 Tax=Kosmotoga pacifica TaxID=1330330 RepID=A0A0G2ZAR7_9BACT|nr:proton-conducting transporter membrane subunit [Kosmotoga pacifica]AKI96674.1 NADH dehydrogenase [Kosmotoga pacifica]
MELTGLLLAMVVASPVLYLLAKMSKMLAYVLLMIEEIAIFGILLLNKGVVSQYEWVELFGNLKLNFSITPLSWFLGTIVMLVIALTTLFMLPIKHKSAIKVFLFNIISAAALGAFFAADFFTLLIFVEIMTWATLIMIVQDRKYSWKEALKYVATGAVGSYSFMYAVFMLYKKFGTLEYSAVGQALSDTSSAFQITIYVLFGVMALAKSGAFPLHIWRRGAYSESPDEFTPVFAGVLSKIGDYVFFLTVILLPSVELFANMPALRGVPLPNYIMAALGGISIILGTVLAIRQEDAKKLMAYSSVANSGYFFLAFGIGGTYATIGGLMHILNHALATAAVFMAFAAVIYRTGTTELHKLGGLIFKMPFTFIAYLVGIISLAGIPPTSGFVSKWLIYQQLVRDGLPFLGFAAFFGSIGSFMYVFKPLTGIFLGQLKPEHREVKEAPLPMVIPMMLLTLLTVFWGILPSNAIAYINKIAEQVGTGTIEVTFSKIVAMTGEWDSVVVTTVFFVGFVIALIIFMMGKKAKQVELMDTYTGGEFIYTAELYHFVYKMYRPFDRMFENWPSMEDWLSSLSDKIKEFGALLRTLFYPKSPQGYVALGMLTLLVAFWWLR